METSGLAIKAEHLKKSFKNVEVLRAFADNQPMTPIIQTMRSLLVNGNAGKDIWIAFAWCAGLLVASYLLAVKRYTNH